MCGFYLISFINVLASTDEFVPKVRFGLVYKRGQKLCPQFSMAVWGEFTCPEAVAG